jgi:anthranilate synthase component 1
MNMAADGISEEDFVSSFGEQDFKAAVNKVKQYVMAGDVMQVVPSQRLSAPFNAEPINLYRALRRLNPSPHMYFLDLDDFHIVGSSPEVLARLEDGEVTVRPIAGTRKRGATVEEDQAMEDEMLADPKEIAEHLMLIDLGRNDVGRISKTGTVVVTEKMVVERYSHVMHITSNVVGQVTDDMGALEVLKATLPAGTLSGAPKIRAMEIIDEIEPVKRNIYGGAVGYIGWNGNMDTAIAIRTAVIKDNMLHVQAGAGVVADSIPDLEWKETNNKARALMRAAAMVCSKSSGESK